MDDTEKLLQEITDAFGTSGHENGAREIMARYLEQYSEIQYDRLGSLIGKKSGSAESPKVAVVSHMDEIGFIVRDITEEGYIKFLPLGGWWGHVALAQRVWVMTRKNGPVLGVIGSKPPHILEQKEREKVQQIKDMFIDVGAMSGYDVKKELGVNIGDPVVPDSKFAVMNNKKMYVAKAFDNRVACAMVIEVLKHFKDDDHPNTLFGVGTVQEEVGLRGAKTAAYLTDPDVAIILDVNVARDVPPEGYKVPEKVGSGPGILVLDGSMIPNRKLLEMAIDTAEEKEIPYHLSSLARGGTDGGAFHVTRTGVPSIFISIATRYIHSHNSILNRDDFDNTVKLTIELIKKLNKENAESLVIV